MAVHIGKKIKEELNKQGMGATTFAKKISKSRNVVYDIFERESIDTALLAKISSVLKFDFFSFYYNNKPYPENHKRGDVVSDQSTAYSKIEENKFLAEKINLLENEIIYLKKIVKLLEAKNNTGKSKRTKTAHK